MRVRAWMMALVAGLAVLGVAGAAGPAASEHGAACVCVGHGQPVLDDRVAKAILDVARNMSGDDRLEVLRALASNPGLGSEGALELIAIARNMSGDDRKEILMVLARSNRLPY